MSRGRHKKRRGFLRKFTAGSGSPVRLYRSDPEMELIGVLEIIRFRLQSVLFCGFLPPFVRNSIQAIIREIDDRFVPAIRLAVIQTEGLGKRSASLIPEFPLFEQIGNVIYLNRPSDEPGEVAA